MTIAAQFVIVPIVIERIGLPAFGRAGLVLAVWAPLTVIGTVIGQAATREISAQLAGGSSGRSLQSAAVALCSAVSALSALAFVFFGPYLLNWLDASGESAASWRVDILALSLGWLMQQVLIVLQGVASARQDFKLVAQLSIVTAVTSLVCTLSLTSWWPSATGYLWGISTSFVTTTIGAIWLVRYSGEQATSVEASWHEATATLLRFGRWQVVSQLAGTVGNQIDRFTLAALASPAIIGQYNAANRVQEAGYMLVMKAAEVLFPRFGANSADDEDKRLRLFVLASWAVVTFSCMILAPIVTLAEPLMRLWVGAETAQGGALLLQVLTVGGLIGCGSSVFSFYLMGVGHTRVLAAISMIYSMLTIAFSVVALLAVGPVAAGTGLALASLVRVALAMFWCRRRLFPNSTWAAILVSSATPLLASIGLAWGLGATLPVQSIQRWWQLGLAFLVTMLAVGAITVLITAASSFGRHLLRSLSHDLRRAWAVVA